MKLFYSPGACSMSCHIALLEAKLPHESINVSKNASPETRKAFLAANPLGAVPALQIDDKHAITQNIAILEYIADQKPESKLLAAAGTLERAETMKWLSLVGSDLHPAFSPLFSLGNISTDPRAQADITKWCLDKLNKYFTLLDTHLQHRKYLAGDHFSIADCYCYTVYQWTKPMKIATDKYTALNRYADAIAQLPAVVAVKERERTAEAH